MTVDEIARSLGSVAAPPQRGEVLHFKDGFTVINDSYNSNPDALMSMVRTLVEGSPNAKRRIVVAGEMLELGAGAEEKHNLIGKSIASENIDFLIGVRGLARQIVKGASDCYIKRTMFTDNSDDCGEFLVSEVREGDAILIKGSRGVRTEKIVEKLLEKFTLES